MRTLTFFLILLLLPITLTAQFAVVSTQPSNLSTNVPLVTTISITFSEPLDTNAMNDVAESTMFTNVDSVTFGGFTPDARTMYANVVLKPSTDYFLAFTYAKALSGAEITTSHVYYFTTGTAFSPYSVSGTILPGSMNISTERCIVALSKINFMEQETDEGPPPFGGWANVNNDGTFTIPYVANGTYWPIVAKDGNGDGMIEPGKDGDILVMGDPIIVNNASVTGVTLTFFSLLSTQPANLATNVPLTTTISMTFSEPLDTFALNNSEDSWFSNIENMVSYGYSSDLKTTWANCILEPNTTYFFAFTFVRSMFGAVITKPQIIYFTTGPALAPASVSGTVSSGSTGVQPGGAFVALSKVNFMETDVEGPPPFGGFAVVQENGAFTIPHVANGTYWPLAAKDVDGDGRLRPDKGADVIAFGDSIVVANNISVTGVNLTFFSFTPLTFHETIARAESLAAVHLPADRSLRRVTAWDVDTLGRSTGWEYAYSINNNTAAMSLRIGTMNNEMEPITDPFYLEWILSMKPVTNYHLAAPSSTVIANIENNGGRQIRTADIPQWWEFGIELTLSNQTSGWFGWWQGLDTSKIYWAAAYAYNYQVDEDQNMWMGGRLFLCDVSTGAILTTQDIFTGTKPDGTTPTGYVLEQNFPNPFNPTTTINFSLPVSGTATLTVFDMLGREVRTLLNERRDAGSHSVRFNAQGLPSGVYFYQLRSGSYIATKKMIVLE